jgi:hypothetical protein
MAGSAGRAREKRAKMPRAIRIDIRIGFVLLGGPEKN